MKNRILLALLCCSVTISVQSANKKNFKSIRITYESGSNGEMNKHSQTIMDISGSWARITTEHAKPNPNMPKETIYLDFDTNREIKEALVNGESLYTIRPFVVNDKLTAKTETETIAGYKCKKAQTTINTNTLEIWYTTELGVKGSMQPSVGIPDGIVLKVVRNGSRVEVATNVELLKETADLTPSLGGKELKASHYNFALQQSQVLKTEVFKNQSIHFRNIPKVETLSNHEVMQFAGGSLVLKKVKLPEENSAYSIFAELTQHSEGDAYDRTGSVFMIPCERKQSFIDGLLKGKDALPTYTDKHGNKYEGMTATSNYLPPVELMRFYTSFGVRGYNHIQVADYNWPDSVVFKQEVTDYASMLKGEVYIGAWIGNWVADGHNINLDIKYYPKGSKKDQSKKVYPLFTTINLLEMAGQAYPEKMFKDDSLVVDFETDTDLDNAYIRYISTGHGGWGGGDEFNPKLNEIYLDNERVIAYTPWREDCGSYRAINPASGNFANGLSSSDLSRSGWCPGTVSYPVFIHLGKVKAGKHQVKVSIPVGEPAGSSNSYWCISGVLVGNQSE